MPVHMPHYHYWLFAGANEWESRDWVHWFLINIEMALKMYCDEQSDFPEMEV